jgi:hypothetical protein
LGNPGGQSLKRLGSGDIERPSPEHDPPNHVEKIGNFHVRGVRTAQEEFCGRGPGSSLSNQRDLVGHVQGSGHVGILFLENKTCLEAEIWFEGVFRHPKSACFFET